MNVLRWAFGIIALCTIYACGPNFDSIAGEQKQLAMANIKTLSLKRVSIPKTGTDTNGSCEALVNIRFDAGTGQFKFSECNGSKGTTTHVFTMTSLIKKSLDAELDTLTFKKFKVPLAGACLSSTDGDSGVIELKGIGGESQLIVPSQALILNSTCDDPVVVNGIFDGGAMTRIIKIIHQAVGKT